MAEVKSRTWHYARRQGTWFRNQFPWADVLEVPERESPEVTATRLITLLRTDSASKEACASTQT